MKLKYIGTASSRIVTREDMLKCGIDDPGFTVARKGVVDVPDEVGTRLLNGGGFALVGHSTPPPKPVPPSENKSTAERVDVDTVGVEGGDDPFEPKPPKKVRGGA